MCRLCPARADLLVLVLDVPELADSRAAPHVDDPDVPEGSRTWAYSPSFRHELRDPAGRPHELRAAAGLKLDSVDLRAGGDVLERHAIP